MMTKKEFGKLTTVRKTEYGLFFETKTSICRYGQAYKKGIALNKAMERYFDYYYPLYVEDFNTKEEELN